MRHVSMNPFCLATGISRLGRRLEMAVVASLKGELIQYLFLPETVTYTVTPRTCAEVSKLSQFASISQ